MHPFTDLESLEVKGVVILVLSTEDANGTSGLLEDVSRVVTLCVNLCYLLLTVTPMILLNLVKGDWSGTLISA